MKGAKDVKAIFAPSSPAFAPFGEKGAKAGEKV